MVTTVRGGQSVTIEATSGSLTGHGVQIIAGYDANGNCAEEIANNIIREWRKSKKDPDEDGIWFALLDREESGQ